MTMIPLSPARAAAEGVGLEDLIQGVLHEAAGDVGFASKEIEEAWLAEIQRRVQDIDSGRVVMVDGDEAMKRIRENLRRRRAAA